MPHAAPRRARARPRPARRLERDLGQARPARRGRVGARAAAPVPHRAHAAPVRGARAAGGDRRPAPRAARRLRLPARAVRRARSRSRRASSAPPTPTRRCASRARTGRRARPTTPRPSCAPRCRAGRLDADAVEAVLGAAGHRVPRRREGPGGAHAARGRGAPAARPRALQQGDRRAARDLAEDGRQPRRAHLRQDRRARAARRPACSRCGTGSSRRRSSWHPCLR